MQLAGGVVTATVALNDSKPMSCATCKDETVLVPDLLAKGGQYLLSGAVPVKTAVRHLCEGCRTDLAIKGSGKARQSVATHTCSSGGTEGRTCCNTTN